jgi:hypothetical protein
MRFFARVVENAFFASVDHWLSQAFGKTSFPISTIVPEGKISD